MIDMTNSGIRLLLLGVLSAGIAIALGAFGAHGLKDALSGEMLRHYETATQYQLYHAFAMLAVGILSIIQVVSERAIIAGWCFALGTLLFSGSLYGFALTENTIFTYVTPFGGIAFLAGWGIFLWSIVRRS